MSLNSSDILILMLVGVLALAFLIFAGLALSVRSFTVLTELIAQIGSWVVQLQRESKQVQTTLSDVKAHVVNSALQGGTPTMPGTPDATSTEHGDTTTQ